MNKGVEKKQGSSGTPTGKGTTEGPYAVVKDPLTGLEYPVDNRNTPDAWKKLSALVKKIQNVGTPGAE